MTKPGCGIIQDLLMSYNDGLTAENITEMIQEHLAECPQCQEKYEELKRNREYVEAAEASRGKSFGEKLRGMKYYMIGMVIGLAAPLVVIALWFSVAGIVSYIESIAWSYSLY